MVCGCILTHSKLKKVFCNASKHVHRNRSERRDTPEAGGISKVQRRRTFFSRRCPLRCCFRFRPFLPWPFSRNPLSYCPSPLSKENTRTKAVYTWTMANVNRKSEATINELGQVHDPRGNFGSVLYLDPCWPIHEIQYLPSKMHLRAVNSQTYALTIPSPQSGPI